MSRSSIAIVLALWVGALTLWLLFGLWQIAVLALAIHVLEYAFFLRARGGRAVSRRGTVKDLPLTLVFGAVYLRTVWPAAGDRQEQDF